MFLSEKIIFKKREHSRVKIVFIVVMAIFLLAIFFILSGHNVGASVPRIFSYQGRLYDNQNNLLGGSGTNYYFRFSIWDSPTVGVGAKLWPAGAPQVATSTVEYGVFNVLIGDAALGGDPLTLDFNSVNYYLQIEVASLANFSDGETLSPRQRIVASGFAINADTVDSYDAMQSATGTAIPVLTDGNLILGSFSPQINATSTNALTLQGNDGAGNLVLNPSSGFVGIGTSTPLSKLHLVGNGGSFLLEGVDHTYISWYPDGFSAGRKAYTGFSSAGDNNFTIVNEIPGANIILLPSGGSVGIGTQIPSGRLEIAGGYATSGLAAGDFGLHFGSGGAAPDHSQIWWGDNTGWKLYFGTKNALGDFLPQVTFTDTGLVGIGTSSPASALDVRGKLSVLGDVSFLPEFNSTTSLKIADAFNTENMFTADSLNNRIKIGDDDAAGNPTTLFVVDTKTDAGDPLGVNGAIYYNQSLNKFRCFQNSAWKNCDDKKEKHNATLLRSATGVKMMNAPTGGAEITNLVTRKKVDLSEGGDVRAQFAHSLNSDVIKLRIDFSTDDCQSWNATPLVPAFGAMVLANNNQTSAFTAIPLAALGEVCVRAVIIGNGALDSVVRYISIDVE